MRIVTTIGLDIAKSVFQVHGVDAAGRGHSPSVEASLRPGVFREAATLLSRHRGLRLIAPLVARAPDTWPHRAADATRLREALRQTE